MYRGISKKIILAGAGVVFSFLLLEAGLRAGGALFIFIQERANRRCFDLEGTYRILCLGESTTAGQYPRFLEKALNRDCPELRARVIDKGIVAGNSASILDYVQSHLDTYRPHMAVVMMGCNDEELLYYKGISDAGSGVFKYSRAYRLLRIMYSRFIDKMRLFQSRFPKHEAVDYCNLGWRFINQRDPAQAEAAFKEGLLKDPGDDSLYCALGTVYRTQGKFPQARAALNKAISLKPANSQAYVELARLYRSLGKLGEAEEAARRAAILDPGGFRTHIVLGRICRSRGKFAEAEAEFKKAITLAPGNKDAYFALGVFYRDQKRSLEAESAFKKVIELDARDDAAYVELGVLYLARSKPAQAKAVFLDAIALGLGSESLYGFGSVLYEQLGKPALSLEYSRRANELRLSSDNPLTQGNYHALKKALDARGVRLVCVQYPMRSIAVLKKIFQGVDKGIIFVDNEKPFRDAVKSDGYSVYFIDMFAGDFGHCTDAGNTLLAQTIAKAIVKEVCH